MSRLVLLLGFAACPRSEAPAEPAAAPSAPSTTQAAPAVITAEKLDAWLAYHHALDAQTQDAGLDAKHLAALERDVRRLHTLSEAELDLLEDCISAVVSQRAIAKLTGVEAVREFEKATVGLKPEQRQKVEAAFGDVRAKAQQATSLDAERARFGDAAVQLVLAREAEITATWNSLMDGRGERR